MTPTIIEEGGQRFVKIPLTTYEKLTEDAEMLADIAAYDAAKRIMNESGDTGMSSQAFKRILAGEPPLLVWRDYRNLTQQQLADASGVNRSLIGHIESGKKTGSIPTLKALAAALGCTLDDLVE